MDWIGLVMVLAAGAAVALLVAVARTAWVLTHPPRRTYSYAVARSLPGTPDEIPPSEGGPRRFRSWSHRRAGIEFAVWEVEGSRPDGPVVIWSHGWGESRLHALARAGPLAECASSLILWDLRGHGESGGTCRLGTDEIDDLCSLVEAVASAVGATDGSGGRVPRPVVLAGFSLGAGVSIGAAAMSRDGSTPVRVVGVIAEAPYRLASTPARAVLRLAGLPGGPILDAALAWLRLRGVAIGDSRFDRARLAERLACPLLVLRGAADEVSPREDAEAIARAARARGAPVEMAVISGAGHANVWRAGAEARAEATRAVAAWFARVGVDNSLPATPPTIATTRNR